MVLGFVELGKGRVEVCPYLRDDLFARVEHLRVEHATAVLGDEHQVDVEVVHDAAITASIGLWFPPGCRRPQPRCGP